MKRVKSDDVRCGGDLGPPSFLLWEVFRRVLVKLFISFWMRNACNIKADRAVFFNGDTRNRISVLPRNSLL